MNERYVNHSAQGDIPRGVLVATVKVLRSYRERLEREVEVMSRGPHAESFVETRRKLIEIIRRLETFYAGLTPPEGQESKDDRRCEREKE